MVVGEKWKYCENWLTTLCLVSNAGNIYAMIPGLHFLSKLRKTPENKLFRLQCLCCADECFLIGLIIACVVFKHITDTFMARLEYKTYHTVQETCDATRVFFIRLLINILKWLRKLLWCSNKRKITLFWWSLKSNFVKFCNRISDIYIWQEIEKFHESYFAA